MSKRERTWNTVGIVLAVLSVTIIAIAAVLTIAGAAR